MKTTSKLGKLGLAAAIGLASTLGPIGGTVKMEEVGERSVKIRGLGPGKKRQKRHGSNGHRRVAITGKPWIPSLDLRSIERLEKRRKRPNKTAEAGKE